MKKIAHISDLHFGTEDATVTGGLIKDLFNYKPDLLVVSGDFTQRARVSQYKQAKEFLTILPFPKILIPGNHDIPLFDIFRRLFFPLKRYVTYITDDLMPLYQDDEIAVIGVNTARSFTWKEGSISPEQITGIKKRMCKISAGKFKILVTHHPFIPPPDSPGIRLVGGSSSALDIITQCNVDLLLSGHLHNSYSGDIRTYYAKIKHSVIAVQAGTAISTRLRKAPNTYNIIDVEQNSIKITVRKWNHRQFADHAVTQYRKAQSEWIRG